MRKLIEITKCELKKSNDVWELGIYSKKSLLNLISLIGPFLRHSKRVGDMEKVRKNIIERNVKFGDIRMNS